MKETDNAALIEMAATVLNPIQVQGRLFADVGAAVVSATGDIFTGVCVDTAGWGLCAERSALAAMITAGQYKIARVVAVWRDDGTRKLRVLPPCGICREFMRAIDKTNLDADIILGWGQSAQLKELLPFHTWPPALGDFKKVR